MTHPLLPVTSPRRDAARRFGELLRRTMKRRGVGQHRVADAAGVASSSIAAWRAGQNLPTLRVALRLSESLDEPRLAELVRDARRAPCDQCGRLFLNEGGTPKRYCSSDCRDAATKGRSSPRAQAAREEALSLLRSELLSVRPVRKQAVGKALTLLEDEEEHSPGLVARRRLPLFEASVAGMCHSCEPLGYCRTADCPLRPVSPLPLLVEQPDVELATRAPGPWGSPENRERMLDRIREANGRRWARDGERERQAEKTRARFAGMSDEERRAWRDGISAARRQRATRSGIKRVWTDEQRAAQSERLRAAWERRRAAS